MLKLCVGSGQKRYGEGWTNVDVVSRPDQVPDVIADARSLPYEDGSVEMLVLEHVLEHFVLTDGERVLREAYRVLAPEGRLIITLPDIRSLAQAWLMGKINDYIFIVNMMGAWQGEDGDSHRWHYTSKSMFETLRNAGFRVMCEFDWRAIPHAPISRDWWIAGYEAIR